MAHFFDDDDMADHLEKDDPFYDEEYSDDADDLAQNAESFESSWDFDEKDFDEDGDDAMDHSDSFDDAFPRLCEGCGEPLPNCVCDTEDFED